MTGVLWHAAGLLSFRTRLDVSATNMSPFRSNAMEVGVKAGEPAENRLSSSNRDTTSCSEPSRSSRRRLPLTALKMLPETGSVANVPAMNCPAGAGITARGESAER